MKKLAMEVRKINRETNERTMAIVDLTPLNDILTPQDIFAMEFKLNEIPHLRFHISINEITEKV